MKKILPVIIIILIVGFIYFSTKTTIPANEPVTGNTNDNIAEETNISEENTLNEEIDMTKYEGAKTSKLPILMYHFFYDEQTGETGSDNNWMEISSFDEQMKYLSENDYYYPTWNEVSLFVKGEKELPEKSVVITIDDGDPSFFRLALPILEKYNVKATCFVITAWYRDSIKENPSSILRYESHSDDMHKPGSDGKGAFLTISEEGAKADLQTSIEMCGSGDVFCYPFGHYNDRCKRILQELGFKAAVTIEGGKASLGSDPYQLPRVRMNKGDSLDAFISKVK